MLMTYYADKEPISLHMSAIWVSLLSGGKKTFNLLMKVQLRSWLVGVSTIPLINLLLF